MWPKKLPANQSAIGELSSEYWPKLFWYAHGAYFDVRTTFFGGGDGGDSNPSPLPSLASTVIIVVFLQSFTKNGKCFELFDWKF